MPHGGVEQDRRVVRGPLAEGAELAGDAAPFDPCAGHHLPPPEVVRHERVARAHVEGGAAERDGVERGVALGPPAVERLRPCPVLIGPEAPRDVRSGHADVSEQVVS